jgi:hypothetical protein
MTCRSFVKENADGSKTEVFEYKSPGFSFVKKVTTYEYDDEGSDNLDNPSDRITIKKVNKCNGCNKRPELDEDMEALIKEISADEEEELRKDIKNTLLKISKKYDSDEIEGLKKFLTKELYKGDNMAKVIDFLMTLYYNSKE